MCAMTHGQSSNENRRRITEPYEPNEDLIALALTLGTRMTTVYSVVATTQVV